MRAMLRLRLRAVKDAFSRQLNVVTDFHCLLAETGFDFAATDDFAIFVRVLHACFCEDGIDGVRSGALLHKSFVPTVRRLGG